MSAAANAQTAVVKHICQVQKSSAVLIIRVSSHSGAEAPPSHRHEVVVVAGNSTDPSIAIEICAPGGQQHTDIIELIREGVVGKVSLLVCSYQ
jgi:hypothetical protein